MKCKRGQFYLVAAILIVSILAVLASVSTYIVVKNPPKSIDEISEDINRESYKVVEYGVYNDNNTLIKDFAAEKIGKYFQSKVPSDADILFIYGDRDTGLKAIKYDRLKTGTIDVSGSSWTSMGIYMFTVVSVNSVDSKDKVKVSFVSDGKEFIYTFDLTENQMFYFVVVQNRGDETFVGDETGSKDEGKKGSSSMLIKSNAIDKNGLIKTKYAQDGSNKSPPVDIYNFPKGTKSLVLVMADFGVDLIISNDDLIYWVVYDVPVTEGDISFSFKEDEIPNGAKSGLNTQSSCSYVGPTASPPQKNYYIKVYALNVNSLLTTSCDTFSNLDTKLKPATNSPILDSVVISFKY